MSYDDASNNRALISGKSTLIWNPPSAWAVAKRDAPAVAADCWTFPNPAGPQGRFIPDRPYFWGVWNFSGNKSAAQDLIHHMMLRPPLGTVYNYPIRAWHNATAWIAGSPAPQSMAVQIYNRGIMPTMAAKLSTGSSPAQVIAWAREELEGFVR